MIPHRHPILILITSLVLVVASSAARSSPSGEPSSERLLPDSAVPVGMWVWHREDIATAAERERLVRFCRVHGITRLLVQAHYERTGAGYALAMPEAYQSLLAECAAAGIAVEALDAGGESVFAASRPNTLALVRAILDFNSAQPASARFAGLHFDFEPYTTDRWRDPDQQPAIMREFLETARDIREMVRSCDPALTVAYDIPFWFDREPFALEFDGKRKFLSQHIQDLSDSIGIMSYRIHATGPESVTAICADELAYGAQIRRPVDLSLETLSLPETPGITFHGRTREEFVSTIRALAAFRAGEPARGGILLHFYRPVRALLENTPPSRDE